MTIMESVLDRDTLPLAECDSVRVASASCRCGQDLDLCLRSHCPRCGTCLDPHY